MISPNMATLRTNSIAVISYSVSIVVTVVTSQPFYCLEDPVTGPCKWNTTMFYYNSLANKCEEFLYGGCHGNGNRFFMASDCEQTCKENIGNFPYDDDVCYLPPQQGQCEKNFSRYFFNSRSGRCQIFQNGGCQQENGNNFDTVEDCLNRCIRLGPPLYASVAKRSLFLSCPEKQIGTIVFGITQHIFVILVVFLCKLVC